ncbi:ABC transporter substrate-binding protein [Kitasatospora sp. NPDC018058]|uniref:ABC transporter substrate-binding protein n=1 Tax=Kitasatospora sp. NPDC018058 TaxID=3364025 RepID=UPI0037C1B277
MRSRVLCGMAATVALLVTGCGSDGGAKPGDAGAATAAAPGAGASSAPAVFPVKVKDCAGKETVFGSAPKKIVTSNASSLEMLLKLGAGDRVIGTGFPPGKGTLPADVADAGAKVPVLGDMVIPKEKLLGSGADLYVETFADMSGGMGGGMGTAPTAQEYQAAGIKRVFLHSTACTAMAPAAVQDLTGVEGDIKNLGQVTGTSAKADALVADMEKKVGAVKTALAGVAADKRPGYFFFDFDAGTKQPMAVGDRQVANAVITLAGARNVFGDVDGDFKPVSWEDVVAKNPDWIQLGVRNRGSDAENKKAFDDAEKFLREFPATKGLKAVQEGHFVRVGSEVTTIAGTRNADTVQQIAHTLFPDQVKDAQ